MKFPIYSERPANTESVIPPLRQIFKGTDIDVVEFNSNDLRNGILREKNTVGFCLPGIIGEISSYTDQIGETGLKEMSEAIHEGRIMLAICAGAYFIARETLYDPGWGAARKRTPVNYIFKAVAHGPVNAMGRQFDSSWASTLALVPVWYKSPKNLEKNETWKLTSVPYGNGPAFYPDHPDDPDLEALAFYNAPNKPLASANLRHGQGKILLLGVLPHMGHLNLRDHPGNKELRQFMNEMQPHEPARQDFMETVATRLHDQILTYRQKFSI